MILRHRDPERARFHADEAFHAARRLSDYNREGMRPPDERWDAHLAASLLEALAASGVRVLGDVEAVRDAVERARPDYVRVILSVTTD